MTEQIVPNPAPANLPVAELDPVIFGEPFGQWISPSVIAGKPVALGEHGSLTALSAFARAAVPLPP